MLRKLIPQRVIRAYRRGDGRYVSRNEVPTDSPLGVDDTLSLALGTARREATLASGEGFRVLVEIQDSGKTWRQIDVVEPPRTATIRK
jgi:hypothetical protein